MRKIIATLALALALALPSGVFAANSTGTTTETVSGPSVTISMTVPASTTYTRGGSTVDSAPIALTNLDTNNPTGMSVSLTTSTFTGAATVPTTVRSRDVISCAAIGSGGWSGGTARAAGYYANASTADALCSTGGVPFSDAHAFNVVMHGTLSAFSVPNGTYSGTLSFTATTNP